MGGTADRDAFPVSSTQFRADLTHAGTEAVLHRRSRGTSDYIRPIVTL